MVATPHTTMVLLFRGPGSRTWAQPVALSLLLSPAGFNLLGAAVARAASLQHLDNVLTPAQNPTGVGFYLYVPDALPRRPRRPAVLVNPHWCHGSAEAAYDASTFAPALAEQYGFLVIYPDSPNQEDKCWDVSSPASLVRRSFSTSVATTTTDGGGGGAGGEGGGGDSLGIVSMVTWTLREYDADETRVFVTGVSSGAMMTNVLVGSYPDVFAGGSAFAGVAEGCFAYGLWPLLSLLPPLNSSSSSSSSSTNDSASLVDYWNEDCAAGNVRYTPAEWASIVTKASSPAFPLRRPNGWRPKMQVFHGTADTTLDYANLGEEIKQWTGVLGLLGGSDDEYESYHSLEVPKPTGVVLDTPLANWTKMTYGRGGGGQGNGDGDGDGDSWFEAYSAWNVTHDIPVQVDVVMDFFDLTCVSTNTEEEGGNCFHWGQGGGPSTYMSEYPWERACQ